MQNFLSIFGIFVIFNGFAAEPSMEVVNYEPGKHITSELSKIHKLINGFNDFLQHHNEIIAIVVNGYVVEEEIEKLQKSEQRIVRIGWKDHTFIASEFLHFVREIMNLIKIINERKYHFDGLGSLISGDFREFLVHLKGMRKFGLDLSKMWKSLNYLAKRSDRKEVIYFVMDSVEKLEKLNAVFELEVDERLGEKTGELLSSAMMNVITFVEKYQNLMENQETEETKNKDYQKDKMKEKTKEKGEGELSWIVFPPIIAVLVVSIVATLKSIMRIFEKVQNDPEFRPKCRRRFIK